MKRILPTLLVVLLVVSLLLNGHLYQSVKYAKRHKDTVTIAYWDTLEIPTPTDSTLLGHISATFPVDKEVDFPIKKKRTENEEDTCKRDFLCKKDRPFSRHQENGSAVVRNFRTTTPDSATVRVPISQKVFSTPDYTAYVSGYAPNLDSLFMRRQKDVVTIRAKPKRWSLTAGVGIAMYNGKIQPCLSVTLGYTLFRF